ncbi:ABC transporter permease [Actinomadura algeriensis]|uniref:ABC transporter permease n=1 Tax=Actinomadura algeriensis TaxID=1679523 RepID=A0ABR9JZX9_9ACTN|nr:ABC transporter permease [Actinomadura algeriensis]MBE1536137.1 hypothetical protein [Actinomadura algeriensis]
MWIAPERRSISRWAVPGLVLAAAVVVGAVLAADGRTGTGLVALCALAGYAGLLAHRRHDGGPAFGEGFGTGHRTRAHRRGAAVTGDVLTVAVVAALIVQALRGGEIAPYAWLAALAGGTYLLTALFAGRDL